MKGEYRRARLSRMTKEDLIGTYLRGVRQPGGNLISSAGPISALRKWRKEEVINSLLEIGWPGVPNADRD